MRSLSEDTALSMSSNGGRGGSTRPDTALSMSLNGGRGGSTRPDTALSMSSNGGRGGSSRPLPLKQRTSSVDTRRDYSIQTVLSLIGLIKLREYFITVDNFSIWRRHLAWAMEDGADLRMYMTQRFASSMVFMSLLLGAELNVLFNSAAVTTSMRRELFDENLWSVEFWAGIAILVSVILTIISLISTFTAWGMVSSVSDSNAHCILRSSIGQYAAELPGRFIVTAVYSFLVWVALFFFLLLPIGFWSLLLLVTTVSLFIHVVVVFSAFGRIIMHTGAMGTRRIFDEATEKRLLPHSLHTSLLDKAKIELERKTSIMRQYQRRKSPIVEAGAPVVEEPTRKRADSSVRFADTLWTSVPQQREAALSDIISAHDGSEASQVSVPDAKMERPKRPPRPTALHTSSSSMQQQSSSEATSFVDGLGGNTSNHSLEEWLKASGPPAQSNANKNKSEKQTQSDNRRQSLSPVGLSPSDSGEEPRVNDTRESISPVGFGNAQPARDGRRSISPIDSSDTSGNVGDGTPFWRPPTSIPMNKPLSAQSSMDGSSSNNLYRELTEEEKFDEEYGELFHAEMQRNDTVNDSRGYEVQYGHEESDLQLSEHAEEQQRLLPGGSTQEATYAAVGNSRNQDK